LLEEEKYKNILREIDISKIHLCGSGSAFFSFEKLKVEGCEEREVKLL
jgi:hypothetical protein